MSKESSFGQEQDTQDDEIKQNGVLQYSDLRMQLTPEKIEKALKQAFNIQGKSAYSSSGIRASSLFQIGLVKSTVGFLGFEVESTLKPELKRITSYAYDQSAALINGTNTRGAYQYVTAKGMEHLIQGLIESKHSRIFNHIRSYAEGSNGNVLGELQKLCVPSDSGGQTAHFKAEVKKLIFAKYPELRPKERITTFSKSTDWAEKIKKTEDTLAKLELS